MKRAEIYGAIDGERDHQRSVWGVAGAKRRHVVLTPTFDADDGGPEPAHDIATWVVFMENYLADAKRTLTETDDEEAALAEVRKAVALGVACLEQHGCPPREV